MNFSSIREYFYKLYNICYLLLLLPLGIFIFIYYQLERKKIMPLVTDEIYIYALLVLICTLSILNLTIVHWLSNKRLRVYAQEKGLAHKLDRYQEIIFLRFAA